MTEFELEDTGQGWKALEARFKETFGKVPDLNAVLFLIGVQELGQGQRLFTKEEKQDLMHIAMCRVLSKSGHYRLKGHDQDGWPHWESVEKMPFLSLKEQELFLKWHVLAYFQEEVGW